MLSTIFLFTICTFTNLHQAFSEDPDMGDLGDLFGSLFANLGDLGDDDASGGGKGNQIKGKGRPGRKKQGCPEGTFTSPVSLFSLLNATPRREFTANGCGPAGMEVKEPYGLWRCCNGHDVCYSTPSATFSFCEKTFSSCMKKVCNEIESKDATKSECHKQADGFSGMTKLFGKGSHGSSQRVVTTCVDTSEKAHAGWLKFILDIYKAGDSTIDIEKAERLLARNKGKEGKLVFRLIVKYGETFVKKTGSVQVEFYKSKKQKAIEEPATPDIEL